MCEVLSTKQAHWRLAAQGFTEPGLQNPRLPEEKQMFSLYHIVCTNNLSTLNHSCLLWNGVNPP